MFLANQVPPSQSQFSDKLCHSTDGVITFVAEQTEVLNNVSVRDLLSEMPTASALYFVKSPKAK